MPESRTRSFPSNTIDKPKKTSWPYFAFFLTVSFPVLLAILIYQLDSFDPAPIPLHELAHKPMFVSKRNLKMLEGSERVGFGELLGPEDIAFDSKSGVIYTGCFDGWVKRVTVNDSVADTVVKNWVNTGGRPLGLALGHSSNEVIVADAYKGLLKISEDGQITLLTDEAEGLKFRLTDAVVVAKNGMIYFTDASHKYSLHEFVLDIFEGRPHGRVMSYDPSTKRTKVLARDLYFANGIALSPDEEFVIFCECPMMRCKKYHVQGEREGSIDVFVDNLPGVTDNIHYDGEGRYWIALTSENALAWQLAQKHPFLRKIMAIMDKYIGRPHLEKNGGVIAIDLEGKPTDLYVDQRLSLVSSGMKIKEYLYLGSIANPYIIRFNLTKYPAVTSA